MICYRNWILIRLWDMGFTNGDYVLIFETNAGFA
jgi:hypothetical protein